MTKTPKKTARPRLRGAPYSQRYSAGELAAFRAAAELAGLTLAGWTRQHLRAAALRELVSAGKPVAFLDMPQ